VKMEQFIIIASVIMKQYCCIC